MIGSAFSKIRALYVAAAISGFFFGVFHGDLPQAYGGEDPCYQKIECAQLSVTTCNAYEKCTNFGSFCGFVYTATDTNFLIDENADPWGFSSVTGLSGWEFCYTKQSCKKNSIISCPTDEDEWKCMNDGLPVDEDGYVEGFFGGFC